MRIGIDIDGVLTNIEEYQLKHGKVFFRKKYRKEVVAPDAFDIKEIFDCTDEERYSFWKRHLLQYSIFEKARTGIANAIKKQHNDGDDIFIITSREFTSKQNVLGFIMRTIVKQWLRGNGIKYDHIIFCDEDKTQAIIDNNIDVMIEDNPKNIEQISHIADVICMNANYNKNYEFLGNVKRISTPGELYSTIQSIKYPINDEIKPLLGIPSIDKVWLKYYTDNQRNIEVPDMTIYEYLMDKNKKNLDRIALDYFGKKITFRDFFNEIDKISMALIEHGVKKGDIVTICMPNTPEGLIAFYGVNKIGAVANMIHPLSSQNQIRDYLVEAKSKELIMIDIDYDKVKAILDETDVKDVVVVSAKDSMPFYLSLLYGIIQKKSCGYYNEKPDGRFVKWNNYLKGSKDLKKHSYNHFEKNRIAVMLHTGGTTGKPKAVMLTNEAFNGNVEQLKYTIPSYKSGDSLLAITPIFHGFGLSNCIHTPLCVNMSVTLLPQFNIKIFRNTLLRAKPNLILGVPTLWDAMIKDSHYDKKDLSFLKVLISGGDDLPVSLENAVNKWLFEHNAPNPIFKGYGMTESLAATSFTSINTNYPQTVGIPLPMNNYKIVKPDTKEVGYNEEGEICISGPSLMQGYYQDYEETSKVFFTDQNGVRWLRTGDAGYISEDGLIHFTQRIKRIIISSGYNIYPSQIEKVINSHPEVLTSVVIASPHPYKVNVPKAYIVLKDNNKSKSKIEKEIIDICKENLSKFSLPVRYEFRNDLPKTILNKIDYHLLEEEEKQNYYDRMS